MGVSMILFSLGAAVPNGYRKALQVAAHRKLIKSSDQIMPNLLQAVSGCLSDVRPFEELLSSAANLTEPCVNTSVKNF